MMQYSERHIRLIKKEQELEKLFEEAANRRKQLLQKKNEENFHFIEEIRKRDNYILKPLRNSDNLLSRDPNENKVELSLLNMCRQLQRHSSYYSQHDLPETNLDYDEISPHRSNNLYSRQTTANSSENLNMSGHRNPNFVTYSSSSDEVDMSNYCQFIPTTSLSTDNNTSSSHYSRTDTSTGKLSSLEPSSSDASSHFAKDIDDNTHSVRNIEDNTNSEKGTDEYTRSVIDIDSNAFSDVDTQKLATVIFYPSGSPLISHKYQGSPVVRIDNKLRAGEADYLVNRCKPSLLKKSPLIPRNGNLPQNFAALETRLSHPVLININECENDPSSPLSVENFSHNSTSIIRRTKKRLLEEQMCKRFSVGDYSTRALIEWQNNLNCAAIEQVSMSGDMPSDGSKLIKRTLSTQSDAMFPIYRNENIVASAHNFSSEVNIVQYNSSDSIRDTHVSFSLKNSKRSDDKSQSRQSDKSFKRSNFIRRSMNDIAAAFKHVTSSEKVPTSKKFLFSNRGQFMGHGIFKKRESNASDLLYSVPPFARRHMPPDISGATRMYQSNNLPSSSPNLIAELDPTFHERYPQESPPKDILNSSHPLCKRNRSYRLSFIENAHTVTTKKLNATNASTTSTSNATILRFVQPRRRIRSHNSSKVKRHHSPNIEDRVSRSRSSNRFSCAQQ